MALRAPLVGAVILGTALFHVACWCSGARRSGSRTGVQSRHAVTAQQLRGAGNTDAGFSGTAFAGLPLLLGIAALSRARSSTARAGEVKGMEKEGDLESGVDFSVAPWADEIRVKPIVIVSDCSGTAAQLLVKSAWAQFGSVDAASLVVRPAVRSKAALEAIVAEAASCIAETNDDEDEPQGLVVFTLASKELNAHLVNECRTQCVECVDVLEPLLTTMEEGFSQERCGNELIEGPSEAYEGCPVGASVFAVSCGAGTSTFLMACAALRQFPNCAISDVTVCAQVRSLEEVRRIVQKAADQRALVAFTFASPGMSRFMRQQCTLAGVHYADLFQPLLVTMEFYLNHPFFGVPGGLDLKALAEAENRWESRKVLELSS